MFKKTAPRTTPNSNAPGPMSYFEPRRLAIAALCLTVLVGDMLAVSGFAFNDATAVKAQPATAEPTFCSTYAPAQDEQEHYTTGPYVALGCSLGLDDSRFEVPEPEGLEEGEAPTCVYAQAYADQLRTYNPGASDAVIEKVVASYMTFWEDLTGDHTEWSADGLLESFNGYVDPYECFTKNRTS